MGTVAGKDPAGTDEAAAAPTSRTIGDEAVRDKSIEGEDQVIANKAITGEARTDKVAIGKSCSREVEDAARTGQITDGADAAC